MATSTKRRTKPAKPEVVDEDEDDLELDEVDEDEDSEEASPSAKKSSKATAVTFGAADLAAYITEKTGTKVDARNLRTLIRKMARDGRVNREIVPGNRTRYDWSGPNDPEVKRIIKAFVAGELEADKQEKLQALKDRKAKKDAEAGKVQKSGKRKAAAKKAAAVVDDDEDLELDEDDE